MCVLCVDKKSSEFGHQDATDTPQNETVPVYSVECILYKCTVIIEGSIDLNDAQLLLSFCWGNISIIKRLIKELNNQQIK